MIDLKNINRWDFMCKMEKCFMCRRKLPLIKKHPRQIVSIGMLLNPEYFVHLFQCHGLPIDFSTELFLNFLGIENEDKKKLVRLYEKI